MGDNFSLTQLHEKGAPITGSEVLALAVWWHYAQGTEEVSTSK